MLLRHTQRTGWLDRKVRERGARALERQLEYQADKAAAVAGHDDELVRANFMRAQQIRQKLEAVRPFIETDRVIEVGSGAHGLVFGMGTTFGVGIDPLAVEYKRLFPKFQVAAKTVAAIGEELPFADASFDVVLSDNVIDHAERPLVILDELVRILKPGGVLYFTVNIHHPIYHAASLAHGVWNGLGVKFELSPFADHTVHLTERRIAGEFRRLPVQIIEQNSSIKETISDYRRLKLTSADVLLKKLFFKNALFEIVAQKP